MKIKRLLILFLVSHLSLATQEHRVISEQAPVRSGPSDKSKLIGTLPSGKRAWVIGESGDYARVHSRSGNKLWVKKDNLRPVSDSDPYDVNADVGTPYLAIPVFKRVRVDLGASAGRAANEAFIEGAIGVEYFMMERLSWRNAIFYRRFEVQNSFLGLDSSVRGNGRLPLGALGLRGIIGAGYRFAGGDEGAPFAEVGGAAAIWGFDVGIMLKYLHRSISDRSREDVVIYSVVLSGESGFF